VPRQAKGPRLQLRRARSTRQAHWVILDTLDGRHEESTGCGARDRVGAERALSTYIGRKHVTRVAVDARDPAEIPVADILALYARDVAKDHARPKASAQIITHILDFFGAKTLADVNGVLCREYMATCSTPEVARHNLSMLRAAINHHRREGLCSKVVEIVLPPPNPSRERWLTRSEVAKLIRTVRNYRETQEGVVTDRRPRRHLAQFILVALYTGTRSSLVCGAALQPMAGHGHFDLAAGMFYRRAVGARRTNKRTPPIPVPDRLLAHLRRWNDPETRPEKSGFRIAVEGRLRWLGL